MGDYIKRLYEELDELEQKPVTLGRIEEAGIIAGTIHRLERLKGHEGSEKLSRREAEEWVKRMRGPDGEVGERWSRDEVEDAIERYGLDEGGISSSEWYAAVNMMYSDYREVAKRFGIDREEFYIRMADAFLNDVDGPDSETKLAAYYRCIAE